MQHGKTEFGFLSALVLLFIALKLLGKISWSWWWVLSPIWGGWIIFLGIVVAMVWVTLKEREKDDN